jgi:methionine-rich copper-binding protein CopC
MRASIRLAVPVAVLVALSTSAAIAGTFHLRLVRAEPAVEGAVAQAPSEIRLFFSEAPNLKATSIRVTTEAGAAVESALPAADAKDAKVVYATLKSPAAPGTYTVNWRTTSNDGHLVRGEYHFTYDAGTGTTLSR